VGLESTVVEKMEHFLTATENDGIGNEAPVTTPPHRFRAHHGNVSRISVGDELIEGG